MSKVWAIFRASPSAAFLTIYLRYAVLHVHLYVNPLYLSLRIMALLINALHTSDCFVNVPAEQICRCASAYIG